MKKSMLAVAGAGLFAVSTLAAPMAQASPPAKVELCHVTGSDTNPIVRIEVSRHAVRKHITNHGDGFWRDGNGHHRGRCVFPRPQRG